MFDHLRRRLTVLCTLMTGIILVGMSCFCLAWAQGQLARREEAAFQSNVNAVLYHLRSQPVLDHTWLSQTESGNDLILHIELSGRPLLYQSAADPAHRANLVNQAREKAAAEHGIDLSKAPRSGLAGAQAVFRLTDEGGQEYRAAAATVPMEQGFTGVLVLSSLAAQQRELMVLRGAFALFTVLALCLLAIFAWCFTRRAMRPIEQARRRQMEFVHAASHELRSPLAVIHASLSAMQGAPTEQAEHFAQLADSECMRMTGLVGDMLTLAGADDGSWSVCPVETEPETLLLGVYEAFEGRAAGISLNISLPEESLPKCSWDQERVTQILSVLVDNALSYTPRGGHVALRVEHCHGGIRFLVADNGPGIPPELRQKVFERFFRADEARSDHAHSGLGLCVAQELARLHRGTITVEDTPGGGATFVVELPER